MTPLETRVTTLAYLGQESEGVRRNNYFSKVFQGNQAPASIYANWQVYRDVWKLISNEDDEASEKAENKNSTLKSDNDNDLFISMSLKTDTDVSTVPDLPWFVDNIIIASDDRIMVTDIKTINLDLGDIFNSVSGTCIDPQMEYVTSDNIYFGNISLSYKLNKVKWLIVVWRNYHSSGPSL